PYYSEIIVFSLTAKGHESDYSFLQDEEPNKVSFINKIDKNMLGALFKDRNTNYKDDERKMLLLFDDIVGAEGIRLDSLKKIITSGRHYGITTIMSTQHYKEFTPTLRKNATYTMLLNSSAT